MWDPRRKIVSGSLLFNDEIVFVAFLKSNQIILASSDHHRNHLRRPALCLEQAAPICEQDGGIVREGSGRGSGRGQWNVQQKQ